MVIGGSKKTKRKRKGNRKNGNNAIDLIITVRIQFKTFAEGCFQISHDKVQAKEEARNDLELI